MQFEEFSFGSIRIDGIAYTDDVVIDAGRVRLRDKALSRPFRDAYRHTPLSAAEPIPWNCRRLIVGTGVDGKLPVMPEVVEEARRRGVELLALPTARAIEEFQKAAPGVANAVLHITC